MPITSKPKFPVVDPDPSIPKTLYNFNFRDYCNIGAFTATGYAFGWFPGMLTVFYFYFVVLCIFSISSSSFLFHHWYGNNITAYRKHRAYNARFVCGIGFLAGLTYATIQTTQKFLGLDKNDALVARYGEMDKEEYEDYQFR